MKSSDFTKPEKSMCLKCKKKVVPLVKVFNTLICPHCSTILSSSYGMERV